MSIPNRAPMVMNGLGVSGLIAQRPSAPQVGQIFYDHTFEQPFMWNGFMWQAMRAGPGSIRVFDHFEGDVLADQWSAAQGSDIEGAIAAIVAASANGEVILTAGDSNDINGISCLTRSLNWAPGNGPLVWEAKAKLGSAAAVAAFVGLSDVLATTTKEETFSLSGTTLTAAADDALGFVFDTAATNDFWHLCGVRATTKLGPTNSAVLPVAGTYNTFRIELSAAGVASFYIDGVLIGTLGTAAAPVVTVATKLTPSFFVNSRTTATKTMTLDYVDCDQSLSA